MDNIGNVVQDLSGDNGHVIVAVGREGFMPLDGINDNDIQPGQWVPYGSFIKGPEYFSADNGFFQCYITL